MPATIFSAIGSAAFASAFWRGVLETLLVVSGFLGFGLAWAEIEQRRTGAEPYPPPAMQTAPARPALWLVDGFNVLHAGVLHGRDRAEWWTQPRREQLLALAERFDDDAAEIWVVFDGQQPAGEERASAPRRVRQVFAPSADDWLVARVRESPRPAAVAVVTADRSCAGRARHRGAQIVSPRTFLARCGG
jgi:predicted RNA-binding protein with PIN domain